MTVSAVGIDEALHVSWVVWRYQTLIGFPSISHADTHTHRVAVMDTVSFIRFQKIFFFIFFFTATDGLKLNAFLPFPCAKTRKFSSCSGAQRVMDLMLANDWLSSSIFKT